MRNTPRIDVIQSKKKRFQNRYVLHTHLTGDIVYNRSWSFVDLRMDGKRVRVINTHLEALDANVRDAQMQELLNGPANVKGRVIMAGDFNFAPNDPTTNSYGNALTSGYRDVWTALKSSPGFTGVQKANLKNAKSQLSARIDYIFAKGKLTPKKVGLVGHLSKHRTPNGLWPSDHAGVVATIRLK
jgi:endonuclease/exonuclease/phosphatase family metal-dependent hydrolase